MPAPRLIDATTYERIWHEGRAARAAGTPNPYDREDQPGEWRAWIKGWQSAAGSTDSYNNG